MLAAGFLAMLLASTGQTASPSTNAPHRGDVVTRTDVVTQLDDLDLSAARQTVGRPMKDLSSGGHPLTLGGKTYSHGVGVQAESYMRYRLNGQYTTFEATVGLDEESGRSWGSGVRFWIDGDGKILAHTGILDRNTGPQVIKANLAGVNLVTLVCAAGVFGIHGDHGDWADAVFIATKKMDPRLRVNPASTASSLSNSSQPPLPTPVAYPTEERTILTPPPGPRPRFTGARVFGVRPGHPILFDVTTTGDKPMTFIAANLPPGVYLDGATGVLTGEVNQPGKYLIRLTARNAAGYAQRNFQLVVGEKLALTPPMGWNSWNSWGYQVTQDEVESSTKAMAAKLRDHGWVYVNIDDTWQGLRGGAHNGIMPDRKFPDMSGLVSSIHAAGLKAGIYSTPWMASYAGHIGGSADSADGTYPWTPGDDGGSGDAGKYRRFGAVSLVDRDVKQFADWGFDYLKYDWNPIDVPHTKVAYDLLRNSGRDLVLSLSNGAHIEDGDGLAAESESWRTSGDMSDTWAAVRDNAFKLAKWARFQGPGHWNDEDMLVVGRVTLGESMHASHLTPNEQYLHISQWCMLASPLLIGCDLDHLDDFTLSLLTNDDVLDIDQDPLGVMAHPVRQTDAEQIWVKPLADGSHAVGLYNISEEARTIRVSWAELHLGGGTHWVRDLWQQKDLGRLPGIEAQVPRHGVVLLRVR